MNNIKLAWRDVLWCVRRLPKKVGDLLKQQGRSLSVAGGFIRACVSGEQVSDIDLMCTSVEKARLAALTLTSKNKLRLGETDNAFTVYGLRYPIQFIHRWVYEKPEDVLPSFDFTIAQAVIWYDRDNKKWESLASEHFYEDLAGKRLVYTNPKRNEDAGGSTLRLLKFYQRGYRIPLDSLGSVLSRLFCGIRTDKRDMSEEDISLILTGLLREVDPLIDPDHISHLPLISEMEQEAAKDGN